MQLLVSLLLTMVFGILAQNSASGEADGILAQLSKIRLDKKQIYNIRDITLRRDALSISLNRGVIAFLEPVQGRVTGAVFIGNGEVVAIPPDAMEKQQMYKFTGSPIMDETFQSGIFRFTDKTFDEIKREISQHAEEDVTPEDSAQFDSWDPKIAQRATLINTRMLADFLEPSSQPFFLAELNGEKSGWFDAIFDLRAAEEVSVLQVHEMGNSSIADMWASFNQRSEARNRESVAHENKSPVSVLSYDIDASLSNGQMEARADVRTKGRVDGARVLSFILSPSLRVASLVTGDEPVPFYQYPNSDSVTAVLARPLKSGQDMVLRFMYSGATDGRDIWYPIQLVPENVELKTNIHGASVPNTEPEGIAPVREYFVSLLGPLPANSASVWPTSTDVQDIARFWFGRRVVPASYHDQWLFEGLTRYLAGMYVEKSISDPARFLQIMKESQARIINDDKAGPIWLGQRLASSVTPTGYRAVSDKGMWVVHMLRMLMRQEGSTTDARFIAMLRDFFESYQGKTASTWDFKHVAEKYIAPEMDLRSDKKLDWFFDQWIFGTGLPVYEMDYKIQPADNGFVISGNVKQTEVPEAFTMPVPVYADDMLLGRVVGESQSEFQFRISRKPEHVTLDPHLEILSKAVRSIAQ